MQYQNALQKYFDGELDDVGEDMLFGELAHNHDARREFNEHTKLRAAMQKERTAITPPAYAAGAILGALGYDLPAPVPVLKTPVAGTVAAKGWMFLKLLPYALTSLFSALVAVVIYAGFAESSFKNKAEIIAEKQKPEVLKSAELQQNLLKTEHDFAETTVGKLPENSFKSSILQRKKSGYFINNVSENPFVNSLSTTEYPEKIISENPFKTQIAVIAEEDFKKQPDFKSENLQPVFKNDLPEKIAVENEEFLKEIEELSPHDFSIEVRSITAKSFPENSVAAQSDAFKNMAVSALYQLSENHAIGVEAGREQFAQQYSKNINGQNWTIRQNPLYWYGGAAYRFALDDNDFFGFKNTFIPFGQIFTGIAQTGFLGKSQIGFKIVPESRIAFVLAAEGSLLLYGVDGSWNNSKKFGVTYGVNVGF